MSEEKLNRLFEQARNQAPQTKIEDIQKWIGIGASASILTILLLKIKWLITYKTGIMITTALLTVGISVATIVSLNSSEKTSKTSPIKQQKVLANPSDSEQKEHVITLPVATTKPVSSKKEAVEEAITLVPLKPILPDNAEKSIQPIPTVQSVRKSSESGEFDALKISGAAEVILIQGTECGIRIEGDQLGKSLAHAENNNGTLVIYTKSNNGKSYELKFYVTVKQLKKIDISGASNIRTEGKLEQADLSLKSSGASDIHLIMSSEKFTLNTSGASEIKLTGSCANFNLEASGATELKAFDFSTQHATVSCSGASDLKLNVSDELTISVSGASEVKYKGDPKIAKKQVTGASELKKV